MRYLMLGAGALGGYFGGMLARAAQLKRDGLAIKTQDGGELRTQGSKASLTGPTMSFCSAARLTILIAP